jgi:hypothetical protein
MTPSGDELALLMELSIEAIAQQLGLGTRASG